jgi:cob(I)alamin adenosyltransferase
MLYTRKGDNGSTKTFDCDQRMSKNSAVAEALGTLDELNSFLGLVKVKAASTELSANGKKLESIIDWTQNCLFIVQAEVAGADKTIGDNKVKEIESIVDVVEKEMPPIKTFFVSGGTEMAALLDIARTLTRTAERRVVAVAEGGDVKIGPETLAFMNRLSSLFYAMARLVNYRSGVKEQAPKYE